MNRIFSIAWVAAFLLALVLALAPATRAAAAELDSQVVSVSINGTDYTAASAPFSIPAGNVFIVDITMRNTGTAGWGPYSDPAARGATLLSRNSDFNSNFGTFLISPGQAQNTSPGQTFTYHGALRAPANPGAYVMTWQLADWIIPDEQYGTVTHTDAIFFGQAVAVQVSVTDGVPKPPDKPRLPGVLDALDFEYVGSFSLPDVPVPPGAEPDNKVYFKSGITLRAAGGEQRLLAATGTYSQTLYEVAIPAQLGDYSGCAAGAVPAAQFRTVFGGLTKQSAGTDAVGSMWYDQDSGLFYWSNYNWYDFGPYPMAWPLLRAGRLDGGALTEVQQWYQPDLGGITPKAFWGGVTGIPKRFADQYTGGRRLGIGFGGTLDGLVASTSFGPAIAAAAANLQTGGNLDLLPIMYSAINAKTVRDGNYFSTRIIEDLVPADPWNGWWTSADFLGTGVFIDLPDKQGYVTFARQGIGRIAYDWSGTIWNAQYENTWYFYDLNALGKAATGQIPNVAMTPSSYSTVSLPCAATARQQIITGSAFNPATRQLYLYALHALPSGGYDQPLVHVYFVKLAGPAAGSTQPIPLSPAMLALLALALGGVVVMGYRKSAGR